MKIVVKHNQGITDGIKSALEAENIDTSKMTGSVWGKIMTLVADENDKKSLDEKFFSGGREFVYGNTPEARTSWKANFLVYVNKASEKVFELADDTWNTIVAIVTGKDPRVLENPVITETQNPYNANLAKNPTALETLSQIAQTEDGIRALIDDEVIAVAQKYNIKINDTTPINIEELKELIGGHMLEACEFATNVYQNLPAEQKEKISLEELQLGAMLHDYGKVLIPSGILNGTGKLTAEQRKQMNGHAELGALLLKKQGVVSDAVIEIVRNHHQNKLGNGYPELKEDEEPSLSAQVINGSDVLSALLDRRTYKPPYTRRFSLELLYNLHVSKGKLDEQIYGVLESLAQTLPESADAYDGPEDPPKNYKDGKWINPLEHLAYNHEKNITTKFAENNDAPVVKQEFNDYTVIGINRKKASAE